MATEFTEAYVKALVAKGTGDKTEHQEFDTLPGFGVRITRGGAASYFCKFQVGHQQRRLTLGRVVPGNLKAMRLAASETLAKARLGTDVVAAKAEAAAKAAAEAEAAITLGELVPIYLKKREADGLREASMREIRRYLETTLAPLHSRPIAQIKRAELAAFFDGIEAKVASDRCKAALSAFYGWAIIREYVEANPTIKIPPRSKNGGRNRLLLESEVVAIWNATDDSTLHSRLIRALLLTGARRQELSGLRASELLRDKREIRLPPSRTKTAIEPHHTIMLSDLAMSLLPPDDGREYVFGDFNAFSSSKLRLDARIAKANGGKPLAPWTIHSFRKFLSTQAREMELAPPEIIEVCLGHVTGTAISRVYSSATYLRQRRELAEKWSAYIADLVAPEAMKRAA